MPSDRLWRLCKHVVHQHLEHFEHLILRGRLQAMDEGHQCGEAPGLGHAAYGLSLGAVGKARQGCDPARRNTCFHRYADTERPRTLRDSFNLPVARQIGCPCDVLISDKATEDVIPGCLSSSISGFSVDPSSGALTALSGSPFSLSVSNYIAIASTFIGDLLYVTNGASVVGYDIDISTGLLSATSGFPVGAGANAYSVTVDPFNQFLYVGNDGAATISAYQVDIYSGALAAVPGSPFAAGNQPDFIAIL